MARTQQFYKAIPKLGSLAFGWGIKTHSWLVHNLRADRDLHYVAVWSANRPFRLPSFSRAAQAGQYARSFLNSRRR